MKSDWYANLTLETTAWNVEQITNDILNQASLSPDGTMQLGMRYSTAAKWLRRGAEFAWENKQWLVKYGGRALGVVGAVGDAYDAYRAIMWMNENGVFENTHSDGRLHVSYDPNFNQFEYHWADGSTTTSPIDLHL